MFLGPPIWIDGPGQLGPGAQFAKNPLDFL